MGVADSIVVYRVRLTTPASSGCADAALRAVLTTELGTPPTLARDDHGKPYMVGRARVFSIAHSGELALIAVARTGELGVDVEHHRPLRDAATIARRFFTAGEAAEVDAAVQRSELAAFYRVWCRKEAWVKARGGGLRLPLDTVDVRGDVPGWWIADLDVGAGYTAAIACAGDAAAVRLVDL
jgi:4'-phosphopantetheinyl transferase